MKSHQRRAWGRPTGLLVGWRMPDAACRWMLTWSPIAAGCLTIAGCLLIAGCSQHDSAGTRATASDSSQALPETATLAVPAERGAASGQPPVPATGQSVRLIDLPAGAWKEKLASYAGRPVVVDCWATYCPPCLANFPQLVALHQDLGTQVHCVSISVDYEGLEKDERATDRPLVQAFLDEQAATLDNYYAEPEASAMYRELSISSIPAVLLFDSQGMLVESLQEAKGEPDVYTRVRARLQALLPSTPAG